MSVAVVGAIAFDDIATPAEAVERVLGGSAPYAAVAAALLGPVHVTSVVGEDLPEAWLDRLAACGVDVGDVQRVPGPSFHWACRYRANLVDRDTVFSRPGVFTETPLRVTGAATSASHVFLTASDAAQNRAALGRMQGRRLTMLDTIEREITQKRAGLLANVAEADVVSINESEARMLAVVGPEADRSEVAVRTQQLLQTHGAETLLLKHGPEGVSIVDTTGVRRIPAVRDIRLVDPTGAGDSFAGAALSALSSGATLEEAVRWGCAVASFAVEGFGLDGLWKANRSDVEQRAAGLAVSSLGAGSRAASPGSAR